MYEKRELEKKIVVTLLLGLSCVGTAYAEKVDNSSDTPSFDLEAITVEAKRPDWESKLSPGTVTVIRPDDYKGEQKTLPELLKQVPGVHVRELNGKGQYTTVSVRGSTAAQVGVFVDGVLFNLGGDAAADISTIPVQNVERIEVYRGYIPARFGGTFMGGVINIVTKRPSKANVSASFGKSSYGGYKGSLEVDAPLGKGSLMVGVNRDQSDGDFKYTNQSNDAALSAAQTAYETAKSTELLNINSWIELLTGDTSYDLTAASMMNIVNNPSQISDLRTRLYNVAAAAGWSDSDFNDIFDTFIKGGGDSDSGFTSFWNKQANIDKYSSSNRWRKSNDYKNTDAIIKWQDDHWLAKATWKQIERHLPFPYSSNYSALEGVDLDSSFNTPLDIYYHRNQKLTAKEALLGRRDTVGNLEWGWSVNYLDQQKDYYVDNWQWLEKNAGSMLNSYAANSLWSNFDSRRLGGKIDGSYKAGDKHLIEFLVDGSKEKMDINGWRMLDYKDSSQDTRSRWRNYYEQEILNAQVQDTITLNKKADLWLTPSIRYNRSTILGRSDRYDENNDPAKIKWYHQEDEQTNDKVTWQMALKKAVNDHLTLRATGGTYYRLLNMYEIAGDGAGILPMPNVGGTDSVFPLPEEGSQWDLSAIWDVKVLGTDSAKFQLTYFGRDSDHLLQLMSRHFYFFYTNAAKAKVNGLEMQADMSWKKWDLNLQATYTKPSDVTYDMTCLPGYAKDTISGFMTYMPEWEGTARVTYRPNKSWSLFTQLRYVADMYTSPIPLTTGVPEGSQSSLTVWDLGVKYQINKSFQLAVGVNDMFNKANDLYKMTDYGVTTNIEYPIQGRTYYATLQYNF